jgi:hypothetical protein
VVAVCIQGSLQDHWQQVHRPSSSRTCAAADTGFFFGCRLKVQNKITYFTPSFLRTEGERRKCSLLQSYDVQVQRVDVPHDDWLAFYNASLEHIRTSTPA